MGVSWLSLLASWLDAVTDIEMILESGSGLEFLESTGTEHDTPLLFGFGLWVMDICQLRHIFLPCIITLTSVVSLVVDIRQCHATSNTLTLTYTAQVNSKLIFFRCGCNTTLQLIHYPVCRTAMAGTAAEGMRGGGGHKLSAFPGSPGSSKY